MSAPLFLPVRVKRESTATKRWVRICRRGNRTILLSIVQGGVPEEQLPERSADCLQRKMTCDTLLSSSAELAPQWLIVQESSERASECSRVVCRNHDTPDDSPPSSMSAMPSASAATTGSPHAMASMGATGKPSWRDGKA